MRALLFTSARGKISCGWKLNRKRWSLLSLKLCFVSAQRLIPTLMPIIFERLSQHLREQKNYWTSISISRAKKTHTQRFKILVLFLVSYISQQLNRRKKRKEIAFLCKLSLKKTKILLINSVKNKSHILKPICLTNTTC